MKKRVWNFLPALLSIFLSYCTLFSEPQVDGAYEQSDTTKDTAIGGVMGAVAGGMVSSSAGPGTLLGLAIGQGWARYDGNIDHLSKSLNKQGVQVIQVGEYVEILIPSDLLFDEPQGYELKMPSYSLLNNVGNLLQHYGPVDVDIVAFTDELGLDDEKGMISSLQAQSVATYLWTHGIDLQRLHPYGGAHSATIAEDTTPLGSGYNRRVELNLRRTYPTKMGKVEA